MTIEKLLKTEEEARPQDRMQSLLTDNQPQDDSEDDERNRERAGDRNTVFLVVTLWKSSIAMSP